jgi:hypothetical protein
MSQTLNQELAPEDVRRFHRKIEAMERCQERMKKCNECVVPEPVCEEPCGYNYSHAMGWLAVIIIWFVILTVLFWIIFYSLRPEWVLNSDGSVNTGKVLLAAVITAIVIIIIIWLIKACIDYSR